MSEEWMDSDFNEAIEELANNLYQSHAGPDFSDALNQERAERCFDMAEIFYSVRNEWLKKRQELSE